MIMTVMAMLMTMLIITKMMLLIMIMLMIVVISCYLHQVFSILLMVVSNHRTSATAV